MVCADAETRTYLCVQMASVLYTYDVYILVASLIFKHSGYLFVCFSSVSADILFLDSSLAWRACASLKNS